MSDDFWWHSPSENDDYSGYLILWADGSIHTVRTKKGAKSLLDAGAIACKGIRPIQRKNVRRYSANKINHAKPMYFIRDEWTGETVANYIPSLDLATKMVKALNPTSKPFIHEDEDYR